MTPAEVALARQGKFREITKSKIAEDRPLKMSPEEVKDARAGKFKEIARKRL